MILPMMISTEKLEALEALFKNGYYRAIRTDYGFGGRNNNYIEYMSRGGRYKNLSPKEYLGMIRPYLRDLINNHKPTTELTNTSK